MSKYERLEEYLQSSSKDCISKTFSELEQILGFALPKSAYLYEAWWANGGHSYASAWLNAGYRVERLNIIDKTVCFCKNGSQLKLKSRQKVKQLIAASEINIKPMVVDSAARSLNVYGYEFRYLQQLAPECDASGQIKKFFPQNEYDNRNGLALIKHGEGAFCRFSINTGDGPGVYLWVVNDQIVYIGETENLQRRFNTGYGIISPRNCYIGGQSTNCKMNRVVLDLYEQGKIISLYFNNTKEYKRVELDLLKKINTVYNVKDNQ